MLISLDGKASVGFGYGLGPDLFIYSVLWTLLQVIFFYWPNLDAYKMKRVPYLDMRNRQVSFVHGILCMFLATHYLLTVENSCGSSINNYEYSILVMSCGYFSYDFLSMAWFGLLDFDMTLHHLLCFTGMVYTLLDGSGANYIVAGLFVAEVSNPAMHMRIMLKHVGLRYSRAYEVAEFFYFGSFFAGRIVMGHPTVYATLTCSKLNLFAKIVCAGVMVQSYQFLYRMYFIVMRRFAEIRERNKKKITLHWFKAIP